MKKILTDYIGVPEWKEHELPWYPPLCEIAEGEDRHLPSAIRAINKPIKANPYIQKLFVDYINDGKAEEAEIGQRIITAMQKVSHFLCINFIYSLMLLLIIASEIINFKTLLY